MPFSSWLLKWLCCFGCAASDEVVVPYEDNDEDWIPLHPAAIPYAMEVPTLNLANLISLLSSSATVPVERLIAIFYNLEPFAAVLFTDEAIVDQNNLFLLQIYYAAYLFAILLSKDLTEARLLTDRFPPSIAKTDPILVLAKNMLRAIYSKEYVPIYAFLKHRDWPKELQPLIQRYLEQFRTEVSKFLARSYKELPYDLMAFFLGYQNKDNNNAGIVANQEEFIKQLKARGWDWDAARELFVPKAVFETAADAGVDENIDDDVGQDEDLGRLVTVIGELGED